MGFIYGFRDCTSNPGLVNKAAQVMAIIIENFAICSLFGQDNLQFFADATSSGIVVTEKFTYHYKMEPSPGRPKYLT